MPTVVFQCEKCKRDNSSLSSPLPPGIEIKLSWWCKDCHQINGVVYRYRTPRETEVVRRFRPMVNSPMPTVDLNVEEPQAPEVDITHLVRS